MPSCSRGALPIRSTCAWPLNNPNPAAITSAPLSDEQRKLFVDTLAHFERELNSEGRE
jgi:hypothetical protein